MLPSTSYINQYYHKMRKTTKWMFCHQILLIQVTPISSRYWKLLILAYSPRWLRAPCNTKSHWNVDCIAQQIAEITKMSVSKRELQEKTEVSAQDTDYSRRLKPFLPRSCAKKHTGDKQCLCLVAYTPSPERCYRLLQELLMVGSCPEGHFQYSCINFTAQTEEDKLHGAC